MPDAVVIFGNGVAGNFIYAGIIKQADFNFFGIGRE